MGNYRYIHFGQAYGSGAYSSCTYNGTNCQNTSGSGSGNGSLVNTGVAVAGIVTLACLIALVAVLVRFWRRPAKAVPQEEDAELNGDPSSQDPDDER